MILCETDIPDYNLRNCGIDFSGVIGIALIEEDETPTNEELESTSFWTSKLSDTDLKYFLIRNTRGQYQEVEVIEEEDLVGYLITGANHQASIEVPSVKENYQFWERVKVRTWKLCLVTSGDLMFYIDKPVTVIPVITNPKSTKEALRYSITLKWHDLSIPYVLDAPDGIFYGSIPVDIDSDGIFDYTFDYTFE